MGGLPADFRLSLCDGVLRRLGVDSARRAAEAATRRLDPCVDGGAGHLEGVGDVGFGGGEHLGGGFEGGDPLSPERQPTVVAPAEQLADGGGECLCDVVGAVVLVDGGGECLCDVVGAVVLVDAELAFEEDPERQRPGPACLSDGPSGAEGVQAGGEARLVVSAGLGE